MKILVVCQYYYPEPFRITDICEELVGRGHEVDVVTGMPNYPMGRLYEGYKDKKRRDEVINGVNVHRCFEICRRKGVVFRFLNYYSFAISSKRFLKKIKKDYDVVFVNQLSPVMMAIGAIGYKEKHGKKLVLNCLDFWPDSLVVGNIKKASLIYKYFFNVSKKIYRSADKILVSSKPFKASMIKDMKIDDLKISYLPQYSEDVFSMQECVKTPNGYVDLMFAGNVGVAQSLETIISVAVKLRDIDNLRWHIVGDGTALKEIERLVKEYKLENVFFYGRQPLEEMAKFYSKADAMLITLKKDERLSMTVPGKVQTCLSAGKPIIAAIDGAGAEIIKAASCGYCSPAEDVDAMAENVRRFCLSNDKERLAINARKFYEENFTKNEFFKKLELFLEENSK